MTIPTKILSTDRKEMAPVSDAANAAAPEKRPYTSVVVMDPTAGDDSYEDDEVGFNSGSPHRTTLASQTCLLIVSVVTMTIGFIGAIHIYRQMANYNHLSGMCSIPLQRNLGRTSAMITGDFRSSTGIEQLGVDESVFIQFRNKSARNGSVSLKFEMDFGSDEFESLEIPEISHGRYLHDFKVNKTAIIDQVGSRCFVMPLNRNEVSPPRSLLDILERIKDGTFQFDIDEIRKDTRVVLPSITDLHDYGYFISKNCNDKLTYRLEMATGRVIRSAVDGDHHQAKKEEPYVEFTGQHVVNYNIVNLNEI